MAIRWNTIKTWRKYLVVCVVCVHFFVSPLVYVAFADSVEANFRLAVLAPGSDTEEAETPAAETGVPGAVPPPNAIFYPNTSQVIFVSGEEGILPYVAVLEVSGQVVVRGEAFSTFSREPVFLGKTNLRDSVIYLQYEQQPNRIYTTFADLAGRWGLYSPTRLDTGWHTLHVTAFSPYNPYFTAYQAFQFYVAPIPPSDPTPEIPQDETPIPPPPPLPEPRVPVIDPSVDDEGVGQPSLIPLIPLFQEPQFFSDLEPDTEAKGDSDDARTDALQDSQPQQDIFSSVPKDTDNLFGLLVEVLPETKTIVSGQPIRLKTKIVPLPSSLTETTPDRQVAVKFKVYNGKGVLIYEKVELIPATETVTLDTLLRTTPLFEPGEYRVTVEITQGDKTFVSTDTFVVEEKKFFQKGGISTRSQVSNDTIMRLFFIMAILAVIFFTGMVREFRLSQSQTKVRDNDLEKGRYII